MHGEPTMRRLLTLIIFAAVFISPDSSQAQGWKAAFAVGNGCLKTKHFKCALKNYKNAWSIAHVNRNYSQIFRSVYNLALTELAVTNYKMSGILIRTLQNDILPILRTNASEDRFQTMEDDIGRLKVVLSNARRGEPITIGTNNGGDITINGGTDRIKITVFMSCAEIGHCSSEIPIGALPNSAPPNWPHDPRWFQPTPNERFPRIDSGGTRNPSGSIPGGTGGIRR